MQKPEVTIIIPVYNAGSGLHRCIDSLSKQTSDAFEVLFIDDGSTDDSWSRIRQACEANPNQFRCIRQENQGVCETRHRGIRETNTEYVMFMDNDDYIDEDYVATLLTIAKDSGADIVVSGCRRTTGTTTEFTVTIARNDDFAPYLMTAPWARIFRRSLLTNSDVSFLESPIGEDAYFNLSCYLYTNSIVTTDYVGYNWYYNAESVSNTTQRGLNKECDPLILLDALNDLYVKHDARNPIFDYFIFRYTVWYLLWSGKSASRNRFLDEYRRLSNWLTRNDYKLTMHWFDRRISSDKVFNRLCVSAFDFLSKMHLIPLFSYIYCSQK